MEGEEGGGLRLSKRFDDKGGGEVDYKTKSGTAWSHNFLNQKPWHPLSYPNQRRKWIAEQTHAHRERRTEEVAREYAQEQEFYRQTALISKKDKEKVELMQAVSFMYVRPPGYNPESAKAAEMNDEKKKEDMVNKEPTQTNPDGPSSSLPPHGEKKKPRPKDVFGRALPTEEEFEVLKNAPRLETGVAARAKPFGVEIRNVKCLRCGSYGHQSGDRECPLKDAIMPNEESRLKRDDPLNAILAHTDLSEPLKWELKQKPGISPPRGGFKPDDPNQQIVAEDEDIFDEYGGFLNMGDIPDLLLTNLSKKPKKSKKKKHKKQKLVHSESETSSDDGESRSKKKKVKANKKKRDYKESSSSGSSASEKDHGKNRHKHLDDSDSDKNDRSRRTKRRERSLSPKGYDRSRPGRSKHGKRRHSFSSEESASDGYDGNYKNRDKHSYSSEDSDSERDDRGRKNIQKHQRKHSRKIHSYSDEKDSGPADYHVKHKGRDEHSYKPDDHNHQRQPEDKRSSHKYSSTIHSDFQRHHVSFSHDRYRGGSQKSRTDHSCSSNDFGVEKNDRSRRIKENHESQKSRAEPYSSHESDVEKDGRSTRIKEKHGSQKSRAKHSYSSDDSDVEKDGRSRRMKEKHGSQKSRAGHSYSSDDFDVEKDGQSRRIKEKHHGTHEGSEHPGHDMSKQSRKKHSYHRSEKSSDYYEKHHNPRSSSHKH
ncbi:unnamed protein product [Lathyrus oleraceus]|uniref:CBF1-interacting co-repressor CIR N-terminal domain-containing protein n=1 Tax=Pisum sativum TaxID=3888 RepID=A0A9D5BKQ1_PEA|nr:uncharacterized zinc finger CCHC domain-containing protein At4g19190 [Pisum sativum]KAI5445513.1 hypothetical protein KIW84_013662 [Pisum sativum]